MSVKAMAWAFEQPIPCNTKMVLLALADHANDSGKAWPSLDRVAEKSSLDRRTVKRHLHALSEKPYGLLSIVYQFDTAGRQTVSSYQLHLDLACQSGVQPQPTTTTACGEGDRLPPWGEGDNGNRGRGTTATGEGDNGDTSYLMNHHKEPSEENHHKEGAAAAPPPPPPQGVEVHAEGILALLNREARRNFPARTPHGKPTANLLLIAALLREGWTVEQLERVVRLKCRQWGGSTKDAPFLRPSTLFRPSNFAGYVGELADREQARRVDEARSRPRSETPPAAIGEVMSREEASGKFRELKAALAAGQSVQTAGKSPTSGAAP